MGSARPAPRAGRAAAARRRPASPRPRRRRPAPGSARRAPHRHAAARRATPGRARRTAAAARSQREHDHGGDAAPRAVLAGAEAEDRAEQRARRDRPVAPAAPALNRSRNSTPRPRTQTNTTPIATSSRPRAVAQRRRTAAPPRRSREQADAQVEAGGRGGQRTREGHVAERVAGEHLGAQHHEVADEAAGERDRRAREQGVADERPTNIKPSILQRRAPPRGRARRPSVRRAPAGATYSTSAMVVT